MEDDRRSPLWVLVLAALLHAELWVAAGLSIFIIVPHLQNTGEAFRQKLPYMAEYLCWVAEGLVRLPVVFGALPVIDAVVLYALHRVFPSRLARIAWSVVITGIILFLLLWVGVAHWFTLHKLREGVVGPAPLFPLVPPAPGPNEP
jgi:hypothetical protein